MQKATRHRALINHLRRIEKNLNLLKSDSDRYSRRRLVVFLTGLGLGIASYYLVAEWLGWSLLALTLIIFNIIAFFHRRITRSIQRHEIWSNIKSTQIARMQLDWNGIPEWRYGDPQTEHPFAVDLDITGKYSLLRLLNISISREAGELLQNWLLELTPKIEVIKKRQALVKELTSLVLFRDKLHLAFALASKKQLEGKKLLDSLQRQGTKSFDRLLLVSSGLAILNITLFTLNQFALIPSYWIISLTIYGIIYFMSQDRLDFLLKDAVTISEELKKFRVVSKYLEEYPYGNNSALKNHCQVFLDIKKRPSTQLKRITVLGTAIGLRMNYLLQIFLNAIVPWDFFVASHLEKLKAELAGNLEIWLNVLFELEAMLSFANFSYLNPEHSIPELMYGSAQCAFEARGLGHPLIPDQQKKVNNFTLEKIGEIALITGSNMSGKSTFLKTVGINLCLAFAGAPVDAASLKTNLFRIFTCIKINDSVTDGFSFFYAEVKRLKTLLTELEDKKNHLPVLFLIDEIFKGTNNKERLIGSRSYIEAVAQKGGLGIITTHDLELTQLEQNVPGITNFHFREEVIDGKMVFDYKMRPGPCPSTNALKIMQIEGLPVQGAHSYDSNKGKLTS